MTAPTSPYCNTAQVSYLLQNTFFRGVPTQDTVPTDDVITGLITWTDGVIQTTFQAIGYKIPFAVLSSETWPAHQTSFLQFMSMIGTAAMVSGYILTPVPLRRPDRASGETNVFATMFNRMRDDIRETGLMFRADHYVGTKAEKFISEPYGPRVDYLEDYFDPTRFQKLNAYTEMILKEHDDITARNIDWDYLQDLEAATAD